MSKDEKDIYIFFLFQFDNCQPYRNHIFLAKSKLYFREMFKFYMKYIPLFFADEQE